MRVRRFLSLVLSFCHSSFLGRTPFMRSLLIQRVSSANPKWVVAVVAAMVQSRRPRLFRSRPQLLRSSLGKVTFLDFLLLTRARRGQDATFPSTMAPSSGRAVQVFSHSITN